MSRLTSIAVILTILGTVGACTKTDPLAPPTVFYGQDVCGRCGMIISDERFAAAAIMVTEGRHVPLLFDDIGCLLQHDRESPGAVVHYVRDVRADRWLTLETARFVHSRELRTPMAFGVAAVATPDEARTLLAEYPGDVMDFAELQRRHAANALGVMSEPNTGD